MGTICDYPLNELIEEHIWKIKILKTYRYDIMIGIATNDFDFNRVFILDLLIIMNIKKQI